MKTNLKHIFLIDEIQKLNLKKDSSLLWALSLQKQGLETYFLFPEDLSVVFDQSSQIKAKLYCFQGKIKDNFYLEENINLISHEIKSIAPGDRLYMRLDPPMNDHYLNTLMILNEWKLRSIDISNDPMGILKHQEKMTGYRQYPNSLPSYVGGMGESFFRFVEAQIKDNGVEDFIIKPLNAFSGIGVQKINKHLIKNETAFKTSIPYSYFVCQPFWKEIKDGEYRSVLWKGKHLGSILKRPKAGDYLANIAQGATFQAIEISNNLLQQCEKICQELMQDGIELVAFDIMNDKFSEVNITCPGLLVELSHALNRNVCRDLN